jgi:cobalt/nickel transport protein
MKLWVRNVLLALVALGLVVVPLFFIQGAEWGATDGLNTEAIQELQPDYEPWFEPLFNSAELGIERYMFGLQALLGSFVLSASLGWLVGRYRGRQGGGEGDRRTALFVCGAGVAVALALFFVHTEFGELQAFITALQGVLIGFLGYFVGYPMGLRQGTASRTSAAGDGTATGASVQSART